MDEIWHERMNGGMLCEARWAVGGSTPSPTQPPPHRAWNFVKVKAYGPRGRSVSHWLRPRSEAVRFPQEIEPTGSYERGRQPIDPKRAILPRCQDGATRALC